MTIAYIVVTVLAAAAAAFAAGYDVVAADRVRETMRGYRVPPWSLAPLAVIKAVGALGLLAGLFVPALGFAAALGLVLYFLLAVATIVRAGVYSDIGYPLPYLAAAAGSLALFAFA
ncbi:DoxX family protein [Nocardia bovistercoris]|uniref:DoxX family protein n=1 Tax=Nocardia bovistercoris TaxID=2785916 RepID=A0A931ICM9_9NOCA|nr:DoxX family protein [Nocardia bovistercoris]MBH0779202.1 DoxX family protein [Nocardia bovistercoris]